MTKYLINCIKTTIAVRNSDLLNIKKLSKHDITSKHIVAKNN